MVENRQRTIRFHTDFVVARCYLSLLPLAVEQVITNQVAADLNFPMHTERLGIAAQTATFVMGASNSF